MTMMHLNRYARKKKSKKKDRERVARFVYKSFVNEPDFLAHLPDYVDNSRSLYKQYFLSGPRRFAKQQTNRVIRNRFREEGFDEDSALPSGAGYQKHFDYWWTIY